MDLSYLGINKNWIKKAEDRRLKYLTRNNNFQIAEPMTTDQRLEYTARNGYNKITQKQQIKYNNTLFNPVIIGNMLSTVNTNTTDDINLLLPFTNIINEFLVKKGNVAIVMSIDALKRIYILESVPDYKKRNNFVTDNDVINSLRNVSFPNNKGLSLFFSKEENESGEIAKVLNKLPSLVKVDNDKIPSDSILRQSIILNTTEVKPDVLKQEEAKPVLLPKTEELKPVLIEKPVEVKNPIIKDKEIDIIEDDLKPDNNENDVNKKMKEFIANVEDVKLKKQFTDLYFSLIKSIIDKRDSNILKSTLETRYNSRIKQIAFKEPNFKFDNYKNLIKQYATEYIDGKKYNIINEIISVLSFSNGSVFNQNTYNELKDVYLTDKYLK